MQIVLRHLLDIAVTDPDAPLPARSRSPTSAATRRCSASTSAAPARPSYGPDRPVARRRQHRAAERSSYLLILAVEELLDYINRATMRDDRVHPVSRQIAKLHVLEEARHVSFAKTYLAEVWPTLDDADRADGHRQPRPSWSPRSSSLSLDPAVYEHLGIADGAAIARANPHHRANVVAGLAKLTSFLDELGVITDRPRVDASSDSSMPPDRTAVDTVELHHRRARRCANSGTGPVVLLVHGLAGELHTWDGVVPGLAEHGTVVAAGPAGPWTVRSAGRRLLARRLRQLAARPARCPRPRPRNRRRPLARRWHRHAVRVPVPAAMRTASSSSPAAGSVPTSPSPCASRRCPAPRSCSRSSPTDISSRRRRRSPVGGLLGLADPRHGRDRPQLRQARRAR